MVNNNTTNVTATGNDKYPHQYFSENSGNDFPTLHICG